MGGRDYEAFRNELIKEVISRANKSPKKNFFLVVDKTTDLLWKPFEMHKNLPENLIVIEAASLTKHQRGERKHFFGALWVYGPKKLQALVDKSIVPTLGSLTVDNIVHLPRITPSEVQHNLELISSKQAAFERGLREAQEQEDVPEDYQWHLEHHNYFSYLLPPYQVLFQQFVKLAPQEVKSSKTYTPDTRLVTDNVETEKLKGLVSAYLKSYADTSAQMSTGIVYGHGEQPEGFSWGDSFGLNSTRLAWILQLIHNPFSGKYAEIKTSRFSFGYQTSEDMLYERGKKLGIAIAARMKYLQERTSLDDLQTSYIKNKT